MDSSVAILVAAGFATAGWLYTARRARSLSRKHHTINVLLTANLNEEFQKCRALVGTNLRAGEIKTPLNDQALSVAVRRLLNHYEFVAACIRNGDFDERLVKDTEKSAILALYVGCKDYIWSLRNDRHRMSLYEHLEWLHVRWSDPRRRQIKRFCERVMQRPFRRLS
jgi:Domain of unknown function (DUF4760)